MLILEKKVFFSRVGKYCVCSLNLTFQMGSAKTTLEPILMRWKVTGTTVLSVRKRLELNLELWSTACVRSLPHAACSWLLSSVCLSTIDDTGCPPSQSVSPSKTPSGSERSAHGSPVLPERKAKVKRVRVMTEWSGEARSTQRHKRELRSAMKARGKNK